jgi:hypothetical protein
MGDTRALFDHLTSRKEGHWEGINFIAGEELDDVSCSRTHPHPRPSSSWSSGSGRRGWNTTT